MCTERRTLNTCVHAACMHVVTHGCKQVMIVFLAGGICWDAET